jgi:hypothetical protein
MNIKRRIGVGGPGSLLSSGARKCPDLFELDSGDYLVIGQDVTDHFAGALPDQGLVSEGERIVLVPRLLFASAKNELPDA